MTKKERKSKERARFRIVCKGVSKEEFGELYAAFKTEFGCKAVLRNRLPAFDAKAVHEIIAHVTGSVVGIYGAKNIIDAAKELFVAFIKYKFLCTDGENPRRIKLLYGPNDKVLCELKDKGKRAKS